MINTATSILASTASCLKEQNKYGYKLYRDGSAALNAAYRDQAWLYHEEKQKLVNHYYELGLKNDYSEDRLIRYVEEKYVFKHDRDEYFFQIATMIKRKSAVKNVKEKTPLDDEFIKLFTLSKQLYNINKADGKKQQYDFILNELMQRKADDEESLKKYVEENINKQVRNHINRIRRMSRKVQLNFFNYFVTFTFDDKLHTEKSFEKKLKRWLSNQAYRKGWAYAIVREKGGENDRKHFHALLYIPKGQMVGKIELTEKRYSTKTKRWRRYLENDVLAKKFGINEFEPIRYEKNKANPCVAYMQKYMNKDDERVSYSRHVQGYDIVELDTATDNNKEMRLDIRRKNGELRAYSISNADIVLPRRYPGRLGSVNTGIFVSG